MDKDFGAGAVKVTLAHSLADSETGHKLPSIVIINQYGKIAAEAVVKILKGFQPKHAREKSSGKLQQLNLIEKQKIIQKQNINLLSMQRRHRTSPECPVVFENGRTYSKSPVGRPKGRDKIQRQRWKNYATDWLTNIKDWCISRQIWWGA